jgi:biopolymer transport protein ExbD
MTSLIDVIFLLLLFFMLSSTFSKFGEVELLGTGSKSPGDGSQPLFVSLGADRLLLNGQPVDMDRIAGLVETVPHAGNGHLVLIGLDEEASSQRLVDLLVALRAVEGLQTMVLG